MLFWTPVLAFTLCVILHAAATYIFPRIGLLDFPERYSLRRLRLPYPTGIVAILVFLIFFILVTPILNSQFSILNSQNTGIIAGILLLGLVSFIDDRTPLPPSFRLAIQIIAAIIIFATGSRIYTITNPLEYLTGIPYLKLDAIDIPSQFSIFNFQFSIFLTPLPLLSGIFTVAWLCLAMNALNWFDGIPGQVSGLSVIGFAVIGLLALSTRVNQPSVALLAFILASIAAGCFLFDFPLQRNFQFSILNFQFPRTIMGDTGTMFFGLMLGILTIYAGGKVATAFLAFGVPFTDSLIVLTRRLLQGHSPFHSSTAGEHLHHRLLARGWSERYIIGINILLGSVLGITALFLGTTGKFIAGLALMTTMIILHYQTKIITK